MIAFFDGAGVPIGLVLSSAKSLDGRCTATRAVVSGGLPRKNDLSFRFLCSLALGSTFLQRLTITSNTGTISPLSESCAQGRLPK